MSWWPRHSDLLRTFSELGFNHNKLEGQEQKTWARLKRVGKGIGLRGQVLNAFWRQRHFESRKFLFNRPLQNWCLVAFMKANGQQLPAAVLTCGVTGLWRWCIVFLRRIKYYGEWLFCSAINYSYYLLSSISEAQKVFFASSIKKLQFYLITLIPQPIHYVRINY